MMTLSGMASLTAVVADVSGLEDIIIEAQGAIAMGLAHECLHNMNLPAPVGMPVLTGTMQRGHGTRTAGVNAAEIYCSVYYWIYVVYGHRTRGSGPSHSTKIATHLGQSVGVAFIPGNNYPQRALDLMVAGGAYDKIVKDKATGIFNKELGTG